MSKIEEINNIEPVFQGTMNYKPITLCKCGKIIQRQYDKDLGICRVCNVNSPSNKVEPVFHNDNNLSLHHDILQDDNYEIK